MATRKIRRRLSWYVIWTVIFLVLLAFGLGLLMSLPVWRIGRVMIEGREYIPENKILNIARVPVDENIFMIDTDEIRGRLSGIVQLKKVSVRRRLPGTVVIVIKEREPFAIVMLGSVPVLVDDEGYILAKQSLSSSIYKADDVNFPVMRGISKKSLIKDLKLSDQDTAFMKDAISLLTKFIDPGSIQIEAENRRDIIIYVEDVLKVKLGDDSDIERKVKVLSALVEANRGKLRNVKYIDVRLPDDPVVIFK